MIKSDPLFETDTVPQKKLSNWWHLWSGMSNGVLQNGVLQIDALFKDAFIYRWNSYRRMISIVLWLLYTDILKNWYLQRMPL